MFWQLPKSIHFLLCVQHFNRIRQNEDIQENRRWQFNERIAFGRWSVIDESIRKLCPTFGEKWLGRPHPGQSTSICATKVKTRILTNRARLTETDVNYPFEDTGSAVVRSEWNRVADETAVRYYGRESNCCDFPAASQRSETDSRCLWSRTLPLLLTLAGRLRRQWSQTTSMTGRRQFSSDVDRDPTGCGSMHETMTTTRDSRRARRRRERKSLICKFGVGEGNSC